MKKKLKNNTVIRENYRRMRKILLHLVHGRFYEALRLSNHYNPVYRVVYKTPLYTNTRAKKNLVKVFDKKYTELINKPYQKKYTVSLVIQDSDISPKSSAFIRLISPFTSGRAASEISLHLFSSIPKIDSDFIIVQRTVLPDLQTAQALVDKAVFNASKIIVDTDDAFHTIPKNHPEYASHAKKVEAMEYVMQHADEIWVSQENLVLPKYKHKTVVIENSLDERLWEFDKNSKINEKRPIHMVYMGTATHDADFKMIFPDLEKLAKKYPGSFQLFTIGVANDVPQREWLQRLFTPRFGSLYPTFVEWFLRQGPFDIGLSPLVDSDFNNAKSDIKCLDYLAAGIMPVVSSLKPYRSKNIEPYIIKVNNGDQEWFNQLEKIIKDPMGFRKQKNNIMPKAQNYLRTKRSSEITAAILLKRLEEIKNR